MTDKIDLKLGILTISDTREMEDDQSGQTIATLACEHGLKVAQRLIRKDDIAQIQDGLSELAQMDVIITNGGTGIAKRDVTFEAVQPLIHQEIPGFGELFRYLSYQAIGSHAMASRACAFFSNSDQLVFVLPGATQACQLAMQQLILPEIYHLIKERRK